MTTDEIGRLHTQWVSAVRSGDFPSAHLVLEEVSALLQGDQSAKAMELLGTLRRITARLEADSPGTVSFETCTFCSREYPRHAIAAGPKAFICCDCLDVYARSISGASALPEGCVMERADPGAASAGRCSFCYAEAANVAVLVVAPHASICDRCVTRARCLTAE